jgi:hypothetical protein
MHLVTIFITTNSLDKYIYNVYTLYTYINYICILSSASVGCYEGICELFSVQIIPNNLKVFEQLLTVSIILLNT